MVVVISSSSSILFLNFICRIELFFFHPNPNRRKCLLREDVSVSFYFLYFIVPLKEVISILNNKECLYYKRQL